METTADHEGGHDPGNQGEGQQRERPLGQHYHRGQSAGYAVGTAKNTFGAVEGGSATARKVIVLNRLAEASNWEHVSERHARLELAVEIH
jgi:hypothetical protein